jgi:ribosomal-protein-alanine N-acetyltransferase
LNQPLGYAIREMKEEDLARVAELEAGTFPSPWSSEAFRHELQDNPYARNYVLQAQGQGLAGYACIWLIEGELLINNLNIAPSYRRRRLGQTILRYLLEAGRRAGCRRAVLEVRPSNAPALRLYHAEGFRTVGRRVRYYSDGEDALILGRSLGAEP